MDEIGKLLPTLFRKQIRRAEPHLLEILVPLWPRIAGKVMAQHSQPALFDLGVLTLHADCATWGTQLRQMTEEIRAKVNGFLGQAMVKKLRIKTVPQSDLFCPAKLAQNVLPTTPLSEERMDTDSIADPEIAVGAGKLVRQIFRSSPELINAWLLPKKMFATSPTSLTLS